MAHRDLRATTEDELIELHDQLAVDTQAGVPILLLVAVLAVSWPPFALLGVVVPVLMVRQGLAIERAGFADLYLALQYAGIQSPTMALLYEARDLARRSKAATSDS